MPYPDKPASHYDYTAWQAGEPTIPLPASQVAADFDHLKQSIDEVVDFLKGLITSDGKVKQTALPAGADMAPSPAVPVQITANYAARPGETLWIDTSAGPLTVTSYAAPVDPQAPIILLDLEGTWEENPVTFDPGIYPIAVPGDPDATSLICSSAYSVIVLGFAGGKYRVI